ncbi:MAG: GAF domain-containing protein [Promethearchaeota archaeon]
MPSTAERLQLFQQLYPKVNTVLVGSGTKEDKLHALCQLLHSKVNWYNWVGFYLVDPANPQLLVLGPYVGESTEHTRIPFSQGVCGRAASRKEIVLVNDVSQEPNYLACSRKVKSEIVVPIRKIDKLVGVLDIDSHTLEAFYKADQDFLKGICDLLFIIF